MTSPLGRRWKPWPHAASGKSVMVNLIVVAGIAGSLVLIGVSAVLNFRMGYRMADTDLDGWVYGTGAGAGDILKALAPFMMAWGYRQRDALAVAAAMVIFSVMTCYSFTAALGFAAQHRANKTSVASGSIERHGLLSARLKTVNEALAQLGPVRSPGEVQGAIDAEYAKPVGDRFRTVASASERCTVYLTVTRSACTTIAALGLELARAQEGERLRREQREITDKLADAGPAPTSADPQVDVMARAATLANTPWAKDDISFALTILLALFVELGSGMGLYMVTTPWRAKAEPKPASRKQESHDAKLDSYFIERLEPCPDSEIVFGDLYKDYLTWCRGRGQEPQSRKDFEERFGDVAREIGLRHLRRNRSSVYQDVRLIGN